MKKASIYFLSLLTLAACTSHPKKVIVYLKGNSTIDEAAKTITVKDGGGSSEKELEFNAANKVELLIKGLDADATVEIPQDGLYILNAKQDTIIGGYQKYGNPKQVAPVKTQEDLKHDIDSLKLLCEGKNIDAASRTFYLLPKAIVKVSDNSKAYVVGPFRKVSSMEKEEGKDPEVYRFYSIKEVRETIEKLTKLTIAVKK